MPKKLILRLHDRFTIIDGFTLIELLVVMSIMGVLATFVVVSGQSALRRNRDTKRKSDLANIAKSLDLFYNDYGMYPTSTNGEIVACPYSIMIESSCAWGEGLFGDGNEVYFTHLPADPSFRQGFTYYYESTGDKFKILSKLENPDDPDIDSGVEGLNIICDTASSSRCNFGISSSNTTPTGF